MTPHTIADIIHAIWLVNCRYPNTVETSRQILHVSAGRLQPRALGDSKSRRSLSTSGGTNTRDNGHCIDASPLPLNWQTWTPQAWWCHWRPSCEGSDGVWQNPKVTSLRGMVPDASWHTPSPLWASGQVAPGEEERFKIESKPSFSPHENGNTCNGSRQTKKKTGVWVKKGKYCIVLNFLFI